MPATLESLEQKVDHLTAAVNFLISFFTGPLMLCPVRPQPQTASEEKLPTTLEEIQKEKEQKTN
jgi:hypothetical protein